MTIFFAVKLAKAELPAWFDWILVAFVAFHVVVHLVLSVSYIKFQFGIRELHSMQVTYYHMVFHSINHAKC